MQGGLYLFLGLFLFSLKTFASDACRKDLLFYSGTGTENEGELSVEAKYLPRGSAAVLKNRNKDSKVKTIILAALGGVEHEGPEWEPSLKTIETAVFNSLFAAKKAGLYRVAMPFLGRDTFLKKMTHNKEELATTLIRAISQSLAKIEGMTVVLLASGNVEESHFIRIAATLQGMITEIMIAGSFDYHIHKCKAVVEGKAMELAKPKKEKD